MENVPYSFMLYHTAYEIPWLNENFLDTKGLTSVALGQFWLEIVKQLADNILIPFNIEDYCLALYEFLARANAQMKLEGVTKFINNTKLDLLQKSLERFHKLSIPFQQFINAVNNGKMPISLIKREQINQRLLLLERCFLITNVDKTDENRENRRHSIFSAPIEEENSGVINFK
ncbi:unnamed protein product [Meloidogyne enterolobii]|uniref:Uncharacterized protein n=1 Tax=Meloidogyne enterolobii TaxID=390850 RepID=A0ACB0XV17_MELEN